jgi:hypothetical protein
MERWNEFDLIKTPEDWKNKILASTVYNQTLQNSRPVVMPRRAAVIFSFVCIALLIGTTTALAYTFYGGNFFINFFTQRIRTEKEQNYIDTTQLNAMASTSLGKAIDTDTMRIDIMDVLTSGNTVTLMLQVTAKQLDSVLLKTDLPPLQNYRFNEELGGNLFDHMYCGSIEYIYSDQDSSLAANQFEILYTLVAYDSVIKGDYSLELRNFGYYTTETPQFHILYDESWSLTLSLNNVKDISKTSLISAELEKDGYPLLFDRIQITPLSCTMLFTFESGKDSKKQFDAFGKGVENTQIILKDGTVLTKEDFNLTWGSGSDGNGNYAPLYLVTLQFNVPVNIGNIQAVETFDSRWELPESPTGVE